VRQIHLVSIRGQSHTSIQHATLHRKGIQSAPQQT